MPTETLFGIIESKAEARERAKKLVGLHTALREAPEALDIRRGQVDEMQYFIDKSNAVALDLNDQDAMQRTLGETDVELTAADCRFMHRHKEWWKPVPKGMEWIISGSNKYCAKLHPKEIAFIEQQQAWLIEEIDAITHNVPRIKEELTALAAVAVLPAEIAERYALTVDGQWKGAA